VVLELVPHPYIQAHACKQYYGIVFRDTNEMQRSSAWKDWSTSLLPHIGTWPLGGGIRVAARVNPK